LTDDICKAKILGDWVFELRSVWLHIMLTTSKFVTSWPCQLSS
jgi:hypothetical protein